jgi:hypothetical protein
MSVARRYTVVVTKLDRLARSSRDLRTTSCMSFAALELMIEHCNVMLANGPVDSFSARRQSAKAILQKLRSARS